MKQLPDAVKRQLLSGQDTYNLARLVHTSLRTGRALDQVQGRPSLATLSGFASQLVNYMKIGAVPPHPSASLHLLGFFKESSQFAMGMDFWLWVVEMDAGHADARTFGAAIEMLGRSRRTTLPELEGLYIEALRRFPGSFSEYHLAPEAIVPFRDRPTSISGVKMILLQGILTARLAYGAWREAYQALDAALRLYPDQTPGRMLEVFVHGRPLLEGYQVFLMACRAGIDMHPTTLTHLLRSLVRLQYHDHKVSENLTISLAMTNAVRAFVGAGGDFSIRHLNILLDGIHAPLLALDPIASDPQAHKLESLISGTTNTLLHLPSCPPDRVTFNVLIGTTAKLRRPALMSSIFQHYASTVPPLVPDERFYLHVLDAAARLRDAGLINPSWSGLVDRRRSALDLTISEPIPDELISMSDFGALLRACRETDQLAYFKTQLSLYGMALSDTEKESLESQCKQGPSRIVGIPKSSIDDDRSPGSRASILTDALERSIGALVRELEHRTRRDMNVEPLPLSPTFLSLTGPPPSTVFPSAYRDLYDTLTTDRLAPSASKPPSTSIRETSSSPEASKAARTKTGIPFAELRFANWASINRLMILASRRAVSHPNDDFFTAVFGIKADRGNATRRSGESEHEPFPLQDITDMEEGGQEWNREVLRLRGLGVGADRVVQVLDKL